MSKRFFSRQATERKCTWKYSLLLSKADIEWELGTQLYALEEVVGNFLFPFELSRGHARSRDEFLQVGPSLSGRQTARKASSGIGHVPGSVDGDWAPTLL